MWDDCFYLTVTSRQLQTILYIVSHNSDIIYNKKPVLVKLRVVFISGDVFISSIGGM